MRFNIPDLWKKAQKRAPTILGPKPGIIVTQYELEAFAELVALECAKVVDKKIPDGVKPGDAIRDYFQIEK